MASADEIRFGIIGCGGIANGFHLSDLSQIDNVRVVGLADSRIEAARATAERWAAHWPDPWVTDSPDALLSRSDVDAVIVATHHETHAEFGAKALDSGKHVLVQKPMTTTVDLADRLVDASDRHPELKVQCLPFNGSHATIAAQGLIASGEIGRPTQARVRIAHPGPGRESWFYKPEIARYGASFDMGVYAVSAITALMGPAVTISGLISTFEDGVRIDDAATWLLRFASGATGTAETSWTSLASTEGITVWGTEGVAALNQPGQPPLRVYRRTSGVSFGSKGEWSTPELPPDPPAAPHRHFVESIRRGTTPFGTPRHARHVVEILNAVHESSMSGQRINLHTTF